MKRSSVETQIENVGETGCLESAFKQNANNDDVNKDFSQLEPKKIGFLMWVGCPTHIPNPKSKSKNSEF